MIGGHVDALIERYADGVLPPQSMEAVRRHLGACPRCARRAEAAGRIAEALRGEPAVRAPLGFADSVMEAVYREALGNGATEAQTDKENQNAPRPAQGRARPAEPRGGTPPLGMSEAGLLYRRLGLSFVFTAAVLAASLLVPSLSYARIINMEAMSTNAFAKPSLVKGILDGAGSAVRGTLGSPGGRVSMYEGGASK